MKTLLRHQNELETKFLWNEQNDAPAGATEDLSGGKETTTPTDKEVSEVSSDIAGKSDAEKEKLAKETLAANPDLADQASELGGAWAKLWEFISKLFDDMKMTPDEITEDTPENKKKRNTEVRELEMTASTAEKIKYLQENGRFEATKHRENLSSLKPQLIDVMLQVFDKYPNALISGTVRTEEFNEKLYTDRLVAKGFSKKAIRKMSKDEIMNNAGVDQNSAHIYGMAMDYGSKSIPKPVVLETFIKNSVKGDFTTMVHKPGPHLHLGLKDPRLESERISDAQLAHNTAQFNAEHAHDDHEHAA